MNGSKGSKPANKSKLINVPLSAADHRRVKSYCAENGLKMKHFVKMAVIERLQKLA